MPVRTFDFCALQFLNQWLEKEESYCDLLASTDIEDQRRALFKAGVHFRVARNLPRRFEVNGRYQSILEVFNKNKISDVNLHNVVGEVQEQISGHYGGRNVLSATTKFLWLKVKSPIRIYDKQARKVLGTKDKDFISFNEAFTDRYDKCEEEIIDACSKLKSILSYSVRPDIKHEELDKLVSEPWFRERVLDIYLWNQGST